MKAVLTGHSRGLGAAIARELLARGIDVMGISRQGSAELAAVFGNGLTEVQLDLADDASIAHWLNTGEFAAFLADADPALLINNAGVVTPVAPPGKQGPMVVALAVSLNVSAPLVLSDAFTTATRQATDRRILHVSSGAAQKAYAGWSIYCATKAALDHHARAVREDGVPNLRICSLAPGVIDTDMQSTLRASDAADFPARPRFEALKREGALATPAECARHLVDHLLAPHFGAAPVADLREVGG